MYAIQTTSKKGETMKKILIIIMVIVAAVVITVRINQFVNPPAVSCKADSVVAVYGDTYWNLEQYANCTGGIDKRDRVDAIIQFNGGSPMLHHGQTVYFPQGK